MKVQSSLFFLALGLVVGPTSVFAQDTMFISLGDSLIHPNSLNPDPLPTNTPGQVVGGLTGTFWNEVNKDNEDETEIFWSNNSSVGEFGAFVETARGGGGSTSGTLGNDAGELHWWDTLGNNGSYGANPDRPSDLSGILSGPAATQGHSWQKSAGIRVLDLPVGTYEVYATGVPYDRYNGFGAGNGQDVDFYIGTVFFSFSGSLNLEDPGNNGELTKTTLTHENYTSWELGDNYAKTIVTITDSLQALMVGVDMSFQGAEILGAIGTVEIRKIVTPPGDFDLDGDVDGNDFLEWQRADGTPSGLADWQGNFGDVSAAEAAVGAVPEPASLILFGLGVVGFLSMRQRKKGL